ncbi:MAG: T9SS C-terminal target domain-containing protein [Bacteroidetes bacterium]|nr:MAG: T9SS C-terminal target domain-containing protein [Bacteroidota bacterium]MBL1145218.1 T9SS C-terminal target domain-containing protein [Bacteroidota bacterium]
MRKIFGLLFFCSFVFQAFCQDFQSPLSSNPSLFKYLPKTQLSKDKKLVQEDSVIYQYDTLSLPFIDDFSKDRLPKRLSDFSASNVSDVVLYKLYSGNQPVALTDGFRVDTTFRFQLNALGDTILKQANTVIFLKEFDISRYTSQFQNIEVYPPYQIMDTIGKTPDTIHITPNITQESKKYYIVSPDSNDLYTDRDVLINNTFAKMPITIGVATFDGLNQYGLPYSPDFEIQVQADYLTSVPLDLSNIVNDSSVYLSFYYQPGGLSLFGPQKEDSLAVDFYDVTTKKWGNVWRTEGFVSDDFHRVMLRVDQKYHKKGFQFRIRNKAQGSGAYDHWHIDYIYLNDNRTANDTSKKDISFVYPPSKLLKDYYVMPWWHFKSNPPLYQADKTSSIIRNNYSQGLNLYYRMNLEDPNGTTPFYTYPPSSSFFILSSHDTISLNYDINFNYNINDVTGPGLLPATYSIDFNPGSSQSKDFITANDTIHTGINLQNYYAYDDGTAEAGYGVNPELSSEGYVAYLAVKHEIPYIDTIGGVQIYFLPTYPDVQKQSFELMVWNNLNSNAVVFKHTVKNKPFYTEDNGFYTLWFDSAVVVNQSFYIGMKTIGKYSNSIGMDLNTDNRDKIFWSFNGNNWNSPSVGISNGSLMIRPIFRKKKFGVGVENAKAEVKNEIHWYPNPVKQILYTNAKNNIRGTKVKIFGLTGNLIKETQFSSELDVSDLKEGIYFIQTIDKSGYTSTQKIIKSN